MTSFKFTCDVLDFTVCFSSLHFTSLLSSTRLNFTVLGSVVPSYYYKLTVSVFTVQCIPAHSCVMCAADGAGLVYCSVKEDKNCDLLHKYLLHLLYSFPFTHAAHVVEKELLFMCVIEMKSSEVNISYICIFSVDYLV